MGRSGRTASPHPSTNHSRDLQQQQPPQRDGLHAGCTIHTPAWPAAARSHSPRAPYLSLSPSTSCSARSWILPLQWQGASALQGVTPREQQQTQQQLDHPQVSGFGVVCCIMVLSGATWGRPYAASSAAGALEDTTAHPPPPNQVHDHQKQQQLLHTGSGRDSGLVAGPAVVAANHIHCKTSTAEQPQLAPSMPILQPPQSVPCGKHSSAVVACKGNFWSQGRARKVFTSCIFVCPAGRKQACAHHHPQHNKHPAPCSPLTASSTTTTSTLQPSDIQQQQQHQHPAAL